MAYQGDVSLSQSLSQRQELIVCRGLGRQQGLRLCADLWSDAAGPHAGQCPGCSLSGDNTLHFTSLPQCWIFLEFNQQRTNHHHLSPASPQTSPVTTSYFLTNKLYWTPPPLPCPVCPPKGVSCCQASQVHAWQSAISAVNIARNNKYKVCLLLSSPGRDRTRTIHTVYSIHTR